MKMSSWCKSRTHLFLNSDYALIPLSTDLFRTSVTAQSFYWAVSYFTFALESVWEQWLKTKRRENVLAWDLSHVHIQVLWLLTKENTRIKHNLNFWRQVNSVPLCLLPCLQNQSCWCCLSSGMPTMPCHFTAFLFQSLASAFKDSITAKHLLPANSLLPHHNQFLV